MNRTEFMQKLTELLTDVPENERNEAVSFYNDYFDEAGAENEESVIAELESPDKVAKIIIAALSGHEDESNMEYSESGFKDRRFAFREELARRTETPYNSGKAVKPMSAGKVFLIIVLCIVAIPVGIPLAIGVFSVLFGIAVTVAALVFSLGVTAIALFVIGIVLLVAGFIKLFAAPFAAMCLLGAGLILTGLSILGVLIVAYGASVVVPAVVRGIVSLFRLPFRKKKVV